MPISLKKHVVSYCRTFAFVVAAAILSNCSDSTAPEEQTPTLKYREEAEQVALWTSGTLRPQEWLVEQIDHELTLLRETWSDSSREVGVRFNPPWTQGHVWVKTDSALYKSVGEGSDARLNQLVRELNLSVADSGAWIYPGTFFVEYASNLHPFRVAEYFVGFPGVISVSIGGQLQDWDSWYARVPLASGARYYFKRSTCPDIWNAYAFFEVSDDSAKCLGVHYECFDSMAHNIDISTFDPKRFDEIIDSLASVRPAWVDTVRHITSEFERNNNAFNWARGQ